MFKDSNPVGIIDYATFNPISAMANPYSLDALLCNTILNTDSYKLGHFTFEEPGTTGDYAYIEARKGGDFDEVVLFGPQYFLLYYLTKPITQEMIDDAEMQALHHGLPFNRDGWELIVSRYKGYMPVRVKALREGMIVPHGVVQITIENTDPDLSWCSRHVETALLRADWFGSTIAARMARWQAKLMPFLSLSGSPETIAFKIVDFGARGSETTESAAVAGAATLISNQVTDNQMAIRLARLAYPGSDLRAPEGYFMPGYSIPATEHSVTTAWCARREFNFFQNIIRVHGSKPRQNGARNLVSVVIDTYDQDQAVKLWLTPTGVPISAQYTNPETDEEFTVELEGGLLDELKASDMAVVLRPDSGDPRTNIPYLLNLIESYVGSTMNDKGFKMLPDFVRVIQGDSVDERSLVEIAQAIIDAGWSLDNVNFGSGGGLLQKDVTRDSHRYAQKASEVVVNGEVRAIQKKPKTDPSKASKAGRFSVVYRDNKLITIPEGSMLPGEVDQLEVVFENGIVYRIMSFQQVRDTFEECKDRAEQREVAVA